MDIYVYIYTYVCAYTNMYDCVYTNILVFTHVYQSIHIFVILICTHTYQSIYIFVRMCIPTNTHKYTYINMYVCLYVHNVYSFPGKYFVKTRYMHVSTYISICM